MTCRLRHEPIGVQVEAAKQRAAMVPEKYRRRRTPTVQAQAPEGTAFCAGCQSFRDLRDFGKRATQCRACASAAQHGAMIEKTYGLSAHEYDALLKRQGGRCAICRARPKSKRLAVDHDHQSGAVRGLLCSRCNHDLLGSAWDSLALATALWHYLNTPPATGRWLPPDEAPQLEPVKDARRPPERPKGDGAIVALGGGDSAPIVAQRPAGVRFLPIGSESVPGKTGIWRYFAEPEADPPF